MPLFEGLALSTVMGVVYALGTPGLIIVLWWVDQRRIEQIQTAHSADVNRILQAYKEDVKKVSSFYHSSVKLVEAYEKLSGELSGVIHLNTQVSTRLVERIDSNMFCPLVREKGPSRN